MASSINASTTAGVVTTADTSGVLNLQTAGTTAIAIDASQAVSFTNAPTVTGGTANGVAYLNGSKVLTTGSALVFDGTNLGLGVTPSAWNNIFKAVQINAQGCLMATSATMQMGNNIFYDGAYKFIGTGYASRYYQATGQHVWTVSTASGTAGGAITETQAMTLDASGNLGLGTSSPTANTGTSLVLYHSATPRIRLTNSTTGTAASDGSEISIFNSDLAIENREAANIIFYNGGSERARIDSSGNLLVGATSRGQSTERLYVSGASSTGGSGVVGFLNSDNNAAADSAPPLVLHKTRSTTSSSARFVQFYADGVANQAMGGIVGNGASNVQFASISDAREKTNIAPISGSLEKVVALRPVEFDWIANGEHCPAGFVAQEVQAIFPEYVVENMADEGQEQRFGLTGGLTGGIIPHLVKAIQEQQALITQLQADVAALKGA